MQTLPEIQSELNAPRARMATGQQALLADLGSLAAGHAGRIPRARPEGDKIRPGKGLNFPDSALLLLALSDKDLLDLDFVAREADIVGYSFVQTAAGMDLLADELEARVSQPAGNHCSRCQPGAIWPDDRAW